MYGLIVSMKTTEGDRDKLISILGAAMNDLPGCISHVIAEDREDKTLIWITEIWENQKDHQAAIQMPKVQHAITQGGPLILGMPVRVETNPVA
jgi:quinol monooxygenase YgiN